MRTRRSSSGNCKAMALPRRFYSPDTLGQATSLVHELGHDRPGPTTSALDLECLQGGSYGYTLSSQACSAFRRSVRLLLTWIIGLPDKRSGSNVFVEFRPDGISRPGHQKERNMPKGNKRNGNREAKKPKKEKPVHSSIADSQSGKSSVTIGGQKTK